MGMLDEIRQQPQILQRALKVNKRAASEAARLLSESTHAVIAARGTSDNAARFAQYVWGTRNGVSVGLTTPSLFSVYDNPPRLDGALVVGISQSGQSPDIVSVLTEGRRQNRRTVAITNDVESPLAAVADVVLDLSAGEEVAVAATKTYTAQLALIALVSEASSGVRMTEGLPEAVSTVLSVESPALAAAEYFADMEHCAVLGRGFHQSTAFEWALKLQELTYVVAQPFSTADFLHGPIAVLEPGYPVLAVTSPGPAAEEVLAVLQRCSDLGATLLTISAQPEIMELAAHTLPAATSVDEWLDPIPSIVAAQLFAYHLAIAKGLDPNQPRSLRKVTRTT